MVTMSMTEDYLRKQLPVLPRGCTDRLVAHKTCPRPVQPTLLRKRTDQPIWGPECLIRGTC